MAANAGMAGICLLAFIGTHRSMLIGSCFTVWLRPLVRASFSGFSKRASTPVLTGSALTPHRSRGRANEVLYGIVLTCTRD